MHNLGRFTQGVSDLIVILFLTSVVMVNQNTYQVYRRAVAESVRSQESYLYKHNHMQLDIHVPALFVSYGATRFNAAQVSTRC